MLTNIQVFTCDYCGATKTEKTKGLSPHYRIAITSCPQGWIWISEDLVCPNHIVSVKDREKTC